jgi:transposase
MAHELYPLIIALLPPTRSVRLTDATVEQDAVRLQLTATTPTASCPGWALPSSSVHGRYQRHLTDLPWGPLAVRIRLWVRKVVCRNPTCTRRIFTERLPDLVAAYARTTCRLVAALQTIGLALGGNAGARLAARLRLPTSAATLLRRVRAALMPHAPALQAIGVDEWAWRRGHRDGTILVDLATHRVVDLLPDRSAATVAAWLAEHPTVTVVCRDRSPLDADGIRQGVPDAVQVVDRFHLVKNLREARAAFWVTQRPALQTAAARTAHVLTWLGGLGPVTPMYRGRRQGAQTQQERLEAEQPRRHAPWVATYEAIHALYAQGTPVATIARQLGISRPTIYAYLRRETPPSPRSPQRSGHILTPYMPYLIRRWREGSTDSMQLWREIRALGYAHSARTVSRFITQLRRASEAGWAPETQTSPYTRVQGPSARAVSCTWVCPETKRSSDAQTYVDQLTQVDPSMAQAYQLIQALLTLVRERRGDELEAWMTEATESGIEALARFVQGLQEDLAAVKAGLTLPWSNGPVEGHMHRLTLLKRQGYGYAGFVLLRQRVMQAA